MHSASPEESEEEALRRVGNITPARTGFYQSQSGLESCANMAATMDVSASIMDEFSHCVKLVTSSEEAAEGAHLVATDVWTSMGQEAEQNIRKRRFATYQITPRLLDLADDGVLFMHCLPAHRGEEISEDLLDDPRAVVWDEAENRLHAQKALIEFLLNP